MVHGNFPHRSRANVAAINGFAMELASEVNKLQFRAKMDETELQACMADIALIVRALEAEIVL